MVANDRFTVAIHPDDYGPGDASSPRWAELLSKQGHHVRWVDVYRPDILHQLRGCHGLMWRFAHFGNMELVARRLLPVAEQQLGLVVFPDRRTWWTFNDKLSQFYLLPALGLPVPRTWVWFQADAAKRWARTARYPLVLKLYTGAGSSNVRMVHSYREAVKWIEALFGPGVFGVGDEEFPRISWSKRIREAAKAVWYGLPPRRRHDYTPLHGGYAYFQEFLPGNDHDTRITIIGNRAFGFRRWNRPGDFRASGSGRIEWNPQLVDPRQVHVAFDAARRLGTRCCAMDMLWRGQSVVIAEVSYTFLSKAVYRCPGHWVLEGQPYTGRLVWHPGQMWPEEAILEDFLAELRARAERGQLPNWSADDSPEPTARSLDIHAARDDLAA